MRIFEMHIEIKSSFDPIWYG